MSADCIFCKIIAGHIPAQFILDDDACIAFLDIAPLADGHTLLVPRVHVARITDAQPDALAAIAAQLPRLARAILSATGAAGLNILQNNGAAAGQVVKHLHIHLIPRRNGDGLGFRWNAGQYPPGRADRLSREIQAALS